MKRALVLSGGGAKGSYEIGAIKALREMHMKFDIVTGTSIGAINAALYAQKDYQKAKHLWGKLKTKDLFDGVKDNISEKEMYRVLVQEFFKNGGLSFAKAEKFLRTKINEKKIRRSKIKFGLVTYSYTTKKPRMLAIDQIPEGKLIDYIVASATCYPAVNKKQIDDEYFIDGGFYDNVPINLAIEMGATEVVAIDLSVLAFSKKELKDVKVDRIKCSDKNLFTINFNPDNSKKFMMMGYNDTMRHFGRLDGNIFTFKKGDLEKNYLQIEEDYIKLLKSIFAKKKSKLSKEIFKLSKYKSIFDKLKTKNKIRTEITDALEYLGNIFELDKNKIYSIKKYNKLLIEKAKELDYIKINKYLKGKTLISYMYNKYIKLADKKEGVRELFNIALLFPKEFLATLYLIIIHEKKKSNLFAKISCKIKRVELNYE